MNKLENERMERQEYLDNFYESNQIHIFWSAYPLTYETFEEARLNFLDGRFVSTILLTQAFVEQVIRHRCGIGREFKHFPEILQIANETGFIPEQRFESLCQEMEAVSRKSYAHVPIRRKDMSPDMVKEDAYSSIKIATEFLELLINSWETF
ncbi:hypothetical protein NYE27_01075 [Paenibacillus sp. FSL R10-2779]|uniref:hypothetical protein n=1 Tax=Paenibacillus sp. FSL R10-2779 TaxID=2975340 RepID=UPI0030FA5CA6